MSDKSEINEESVYYTILAKHNGMACFYREFATDFPTKRKAVNMARRVRNKYKELQTDEYTLSIIKYTELIVDIL